MSAPVEHGVRLAAELPRRKGMHWYVVECKCGWSSRLYASSLVANEAYRKHRDGTAESAA